MVVRAAEEFGPYLVYEQLGIGGMATVHRAETTGLEGFRRPIALKRMLPHVASNDDLVRSFVREARLASHLRHANVAQTYDLGKVDDIYFIAMELVIGRTLRDVLRLCAKQSIQIPIPIALNILIQVCDALDYAHNLTDDSGAALGIIHRDVSPSNVIVAEGGVVKLIDFGIAKASAAGMQTMSGTIKGKFGYMAPEYLGGTIDSRADLFALGIIAYEMLTGRPLFQGRDDMDTLYRVKSMKITPPSATTPDIPMEIDSIVMTALERDPDVRWQRAAAMRVALGTEVKRLGMTILDYEVARWVDKIFTDALGDTSTPAPTRVMGETPRVSEYENDESIIIERPDPRPEETAVGHLQARREQPAPRIPPNPSASPHQPMKTLLGSAAVSPAIPRSGPRVTSPPGPSQLPSASAALPVASASNRMGNVTMFLLLLVAAAASGAAVYFGLPYLQ